MDYDDVDYFPRAGKRAEKAEAAKGEFTKEQNLARLRESGLKFHEVNKGDVCVFRASGKPTVDFFTRKNRWQVRGQKKTTHGTVAEFIAFVSGYHDVAVAMRIGTVTAGQGFLSGAAVCIMRKGNQDTTPSQMITGIDPLEGTGDGGPHETRLLADRAYHHKPLVLPPHAFDEPGDLGDGGAE